MEKGELKAARRILGLNKAEMARTLETPYRSYCDWESGARRIPGVCAVAMRLLSGKDAAFMASLLAGRQPKVI
jgi:DNA-binding transcriptional regulator YiaG